MVESMYPKCGKCGEGTLLPFFNGCGANVYVCTKCEFVFGCEGSWGHDYKKEAQYNQYIKYFRF